VSSGGAAGEQTLLAVAHEAARAGAEELTARFAAGHTGVRFKSTPTDPVSDADLAAEAAIRAVITRERPGDAIIGEEGGATGGGSELRWVVDPLDGTVNYLHGIPEFAVSIACEDADGGLAAVVLNPVSGETFAATRSGPATLDGSPISGADCSELSRALVATGFAYDAEVRGVQSRALARVLPRIADLRRHGAAALDLCGCASGIFDAFFERGVKPWDIAAGTLICRRAGLVVRTLAPEGILPAGVLVANAAIADELEALVNAPPEA
jgi:myo-inositol-1(or 4)-monophosphatase